MAEPCTRSSNCTRWAGHRGSCRNDKKWMCDCEDPIPRYMAMWGVTGCERCFRFIDLHSTMKVVS